MKDPLVSIITVCYNSEEYIEDTIKSVLNQTYSNIEYIIIDGGSTDSTLDIVKKYEPKFEGRMKWVSEPDEGIYDAMNKGIKKAQGDLIGILNTDDFYSNPAVKRVASAYNKQCGVYYGNLVKIAEDSLYDLRRKITPDYQRSEKKCPPHPTCFIKATTYQKHGLYDTNYEIAADYELLLRYKDSNVRFCYIDETLTYMRTGGISSDSFKILFEVRDIQKKYGLSHQADKRFVLRFLKRSFNKFKKLLARCILTEKAYEKLRCHLWNIKYTDMED